MRVAAALSLVFSLGALLSPPPGAAQSQARAATAAPDPFNASLPWVLDTYQRQREVAPIHHAIVKLDRHTGRNIAGSMAGSFFYHPKMTTELEGAHAKLQIHTLQPVIFFRLDDDPQGDDNGDKMDPAILPARVKDDTRTVDQVSFNSLTTRGKHTEPVIPVTVKTLSGGWLEVSPNAPLKPAEYVFALEPENGSEFATVVYPFGVDPEAPAVSDAVNAKDSPIPGVNP